MSDELPQSKSKNACPTCGELIPGDAPEGLCPKCVLGSIAEATEADATVPGRPRFDAPPIVEIAAAFPNLDLLSLIGCGGMGAVYMVRQPHLDRMVALKILPPTLAETPEFRERFSREGRLLARLNHPGIVGVHDFGESGGFFYLVMELVDGVNLRQAMRAGKFTPTQALEIVPKICGALQFAHDEGVLHRDIKPENILLDTSGKVKIVDFGIGKLVGELAGPALTQSAAPGTPQYMAPEQIEAPAEVDHRADIYSLGVVFYEMLTGELPIGRFAAPSEKTGVGADVDEIVFRSLEKERDLRQQTADEIRTEISGVNHIGGEESVVAKGQEIRTGRSLLALVAGFFFLVVIWFLKMAFWEQEAAGRNYQIKPRNVVHNRVINVETILNNRMTRIRNRYTEDHAEIQKLEAQLPLARQQAAEFEERRNQPGVFRSQPFFTPVLWGILPLIAIPGTVLGWQHLLLLKRRGQKHGRFPALIAALFWPLVIINLVGWAIVLFAAGFVLSPKIPYQVSVVIAAIPTAIFSVWLLGKLWIWSGTRSPGTIIGRAFFRASVSSRLGCWPADCHNFLYFCPSHQRKPASGRYVLLLDFDDRYFRASSHSDHVVVVHQKSR